MQHHAAIPMRSATTDSKTPYNYAHTTTPKAASSHRYTAAKKKRQTDRSRNRRTHEVPFIVACSHFTRKNTRFRAPASSPKQSPCNIMQPFQCDLQAQIPKHPITTHTQAHPKQLEATVTLRQKKNDKPTAAATAAQTRYLSSSPAATLHGKTQGFVLRLPPQNIAHATSCSHYNAVRSINCKLAPIYAQNNTRTADDKSHAAIPMRSATGDSKTLITTHTQAHPKQLQATVTLRQKKNDKPTAAATVAHTRYLSSSPAATLHGKTQGFVLRLPPQNIAHATSCSHSNGICNHRFQNTL